MAAGVETRQLFSCLWPRGSEGDYREGVGDTRGNGDFFFSSFPQELMAVLVYWRWKQDCSLKGIWNKHT